MPGTPPITSAAHSTSGPFTTPRTESDPDTYTRHTAPLAAMSLRQLMDAQRHRHYGPNDIWNTLVNAQTHAGRELLNACEAASQRGSLYLEMVSLLTTPEASRTLDQLVGAGIFLAPGRALQAHPQDIALLRSDEGLMIWLQYAAAPTGFLNAFDGSDAFATPDIDDALRIDLILRVLVASGRDRSDAAPSEASDSRPSNPLTHLCCQIAPHWLKRLLELGADANQTNKRGMPLVVVAMRAEALRLHRTGHDPLHAQASLCQLAQLLRRHGSDLMQPNRHEAPAGALLNLLGLCGAAEALLIAGADPNAPDRNGNTLMHHLTELVRMGDSPEKADHADLARYGLIVALRHNGDLTRANSAGHTPHSRLPNGISDIPDINAALILHVRETALRRIRALCSTPIVPPVILPAAPDFSVRPRPARIHRNPSTQPFDPAT